MRETLFHILKIVVMVVIPLASLGAGLQAACLDPLWLLKRPSLLLRSLLAIFVLVPVGSVIFLVAIGAPPLVMSGVIVTILAVGVGPPAMLMHTHAKDENTVYELELNVIVMALAILFIPTAIAILGAYFHLDLRLAPSRVAVLVLTRALIPLAIGVFLARLFPRVAVPLGRVVAPIVRVSLLVLVAVALLATWRDLIAIGARGWLICAAVALGAVVIGHVCGGPEPANRKVLVSLDSLRFPALALLIASILPRGRAVIPVVLAYALLTFVFVALYGAVTSKRRRRAGRAIPAGAAPSRA
jgi:BASS family bile acid:Na+ symporter